MLLVQKKKDADMKAMKDKYQGILCIILSCLFFALMSFFVRIAGDLPTMQKAFFRNAVAAVVAVVCLIKAEEKVRIKRANWLDLFMRSFCGTIGLVCNFYAIDKMNIADANMLNKLSPFFAIIMSFFLLKEKVNKVEWACVITAFVGTLFIIKPSFQMQFLYAMIGVLGGFGAGVAHTYVRKLGLKRERGPVIVLCFSLFSTLVTLPFFIFQCEPMSFIQLACLLAAGVSAAGGQFTLTVAYRKAPAKEISVYNYTQIIFAALLGIMFLGQIPDWMSVAGYIIIIGSAVYKWRHIT